ncbi:hypothetical protein Bca4012_005168 [Brassica carinata]|uniref:Uncharacterized protein n=3 Tax=Brassica TaxID=3705 RepID=A0A0D3BE78_BRAOL|nr:hypothetical protein Bca52824_040415 [Brassica carinata]VDC94733.1 unnamed protein product [Brassica oleracea]
MANTCRMSFICIMVVLLFTNHLALSSSARLRFIEGQDLVHGKQNNLLKLDEIEKTDRARLDYLFGVIDKAETNRIEEVDCRSPLCCSKPLYVQRYYKARARNL